ncbi:flagellar assembly protein H [Planctomycetes bacterium Poly30]|uniref:Flagellar assembly protein FliH n=1 Tax=Saltatorellus ferox TaxID=2528018 RepID=A0A518ELN0_9BACT|nr:flagellar assembly protein H [Planctomycetes bacterium Poly30]
MLYIERHTSPIDSLVSGTFGSKTGQGSPGSASGATGMGRFRIATAATCVEAQVVPTGLDEMGAALLTAEREVAMEAARQEAREEAMQTAVKALNAAADRLDEAREFAEEALSADAVALGVEIARQILKVQIASGDYGLEQIVRSTLSASEIKRGRCIVHLHPADAEMLKDVVFRGETEIMSDGDIPRGSVQLETPRGLLVRDPNAALEEIREQLLEDIV